MLKSWILCLHLVAVISWMAGVLYLWRLLVYHAEEREAVVRARLQIMERRLYRAITVPAMVAAFVAGVGMIALDARYYAHQRWLWAKLALVLLLAASTLRAGWEMKRLWSESAPRPSSRPFRVWNEVPTLLMILIVILVVIKPF